MRPISTRSLFLLADKKRLKWGKETRKKWITPQDMCKEVFDKMIEIILLEVIEKNTIFALPKYYGKDSEFYMDTISGDELKACMQQGEFADVDIIKSGFKAHKVAFLAEAKDKVYKHNVTIDDPKLLKMITDNTNNGNVYY